MNEQEARRAFDAMFSQYHLSDVDVAWQVFLAGWQAHEMIANDSDLVELRKRHKGHLDA